MTSLITAPFVRATETADGRYFIRIDPNRRARRAVRADARTTDLLRAFAAGADRARVAGESGDAAAAEHSIDVLLHAELLLPLPTTEIEAPTFELEVTNRCNAACVMCPREELRPLGRMDDETFAAFLRVCAALPARGFSLQGIGEPTLHPQLVEWVAALRAAAPAAPIMMVSNGFGLDAALTHRLRAAGLSHLQWSFHSIEPAVYDTIMGVRRFDEVARRLEECLREHADILSVNMVLVDANRDEVERVRAWLVTRGLAPSRLRLIPCFSRGGHLDVERLSRRRQAPAAGRCLYIRKTIFVAWNGDLLPCSSDIAGAHVYGNVNTLAPEALFATWRDDLLARPVELDICRGCDHHTRATLETSWFDGVRGLPVVSP